MQTKHLTVMVLGSGAPELREGNVTGGVEYSMLCTDGDQFQGTRGDRQRSLDGTWGRMKWSDPSRSIASRSVSCLPGLHNGPGDGGVKASTVLS
jgi:hypothetical protein